MVGAHRDLPVYWARRLLQNGAKPSFIDQFVTLAMPVDAMAPDPKLPRLARMFWADQTRPILPLMAQADITARRHRASQLHRHDSSGRQCAASRSGVLKQNGRVWLRQTGMVFQQRLLARDHRIRRWAGAPGL